MHKSMQHNLHTVCISVA